MKPTFLLRRLFDFFVFSSLFIALCAALMVYQTAFLFDADVPFALYGFVFCGSVCSYNFHWYLTPPHQELNSPKLIWNITNRSVHLVLFMLALIGAGIFSILLIEHWFWLGVTAFVTFLYSAPKVPLPIFVYLRKIAIGKTIFLALAWAHITALLPLVILPGKVGAPELLFFANRFFFIYAICILFDYRDVEEDRKAGIRSLITYLDDRGIDRLFWASIGITVITLLVLLLWWHVVTVVLLLVPVVLLCFLYQPAKNNFSDYLYYFLLDGLMMLSAPLLLLFKFVR